MSVRIKSGRVFRTHCQELAFWKGANGSMDQLETARHNYAELAQDTMTADAASTIPASGQLMNSKPTERPRLIQSLCNR